ncbi:MarR family transcriptional regulator [Streptomyces sp. ODS28]|uniref:MarR family winged helix-turn-helix transcriptional regulator n=1 Tax=Streptomyces sp. ODS28 TaxID=3136688 RepID=UPI0031E55D87
MHLSSSHGPPDDERRIAQAAQGLQVGLGKLTRDLFAAGEFGMSRTHATLLASLEEGPQRITGLAVRHGLTQPRITVAVRELEERGMVERTRDARDMRVVNVALTDDGARVLEEGRRRTAAFLLERLRSRVEDPEAVVAAATEAVATLLDALEAPEESGARDARSVPEEPAAPD